MLQRDGHPSKKGGNLGIEIKLHLVVKPPVSGDRGECLVNPSLQITPRSTNYESNKSVCKLLALDRNTWYDIIVCKKSVRKITAQKNVDIKHTTLRNSLTSRHKVTSDGLTWLLKVNQSQRKLTDEKFSLVSSSFLIVFLKSVFKMIIIYIFVCLYTWFYYESLRSFLTCEEPIVPSTVAQSASHMSKPPETNFIWEKSLAIELKISQCFVNFKLQVKCNLY